MNRSYFFKRVRESLFSGKLSAKQAEGLTKILDYRDAKWSGMPNDELAYLLATAKWETAHTMQPIEEMGSAAYLRAKPYWPWIGRGLVQIAWKNNYDKYGIKSPKQALEWPTALHVIFDGMIKGMFTGKKLADYIGNGKRDYEGARRIINGTDKAKQIALIAEGFREALVQASERPADAGVPADEKQTTGTPLTKSTTAGAATVAGAAGAAGPVAEAVKQAQEAAEAGKGIWEVAASVGPWVLLAVVIVAAAAYIIWQRKKKSEELGI